MLKRIDGWGARLSPDGTLLAVAGASREPEIRLSRTATGKEVARLAYPNFECIIVVNNTPDEAMWQPVEEHCRPQVVLDAVEQCYQDIMKKQGRQAA